MKVDSIITGHGKLGNINLYQRSDYAGQYFARMNGGCNKKQFKEGASMELNRQNSTEFSGIALLVQWWRSQNVTWLMSCFASKFNSQRALMKYFKHIQLLDLNSERGKRSVLCRGTNLYFSGLSLLLERSYIDYFPLLMTTTINTARKQAKIIIPAWNTTDIFPPVGATHLRITFSLSWVPACIYSVSQESFVLSNAVINSNQYAYTSYYDVSVNNPSPYTFIFSLPLGLPSVPATTAAMLVCGFEWYVFDGSNYNIILDASTAKILRVF